MKVVIFAGGLGTRLGSLTESIPKPMALIGGKPMLWHIMKIYSHYGFNDFIICLGYKQEVIKEYFYNYDLWSGDFEINLGTKSVRHLSDNSERNWNVMLIDTGLSSERGSRLKKIEKYLEKGTHMFTYGDGVSDINLKKLLAFHKKNKKLLTITGVYPPSRFGEITEKKSQIISFDEKPQVKSGLINGGFGVFDTKVLKYLSEDPSCDLEQDLFEKLVSKKEIMVYKHKKNWLCLDTERDLKYMNQLWSEAAPFWKIWK